MQHPDKRKASKSSHIGGDAQSKTALILIDVINDMDFPKGKSLLRSAVPAAKRIAALKKRAKAAGVPAIYVNDNFGKWRSDFRHQVEYCKSNDSRGRQVAVILEPEEQDYFVLKPMYSGFYSTTLDVILRQLGTEHLIVTGFATNLCVLFTANDAYMRGFKLTVPEDAVAAEAKSFHRFALTQMKEFLGVKVCLSEAVAFK